MRRNGKPNRGPLSRSGSRRTINLPGRDPSVPYSDAVLVDNTLYISGRVGFELETGLAPPGDLDGEVHLLLDWLKSVLAAVKMTLDDLVHVQIFCSDVALFERFNAVYVSCFRKALPARAFIGSGPLLRKAHFQVQAIAVKK